MTPEWQNYFNLIRQELEDAENIAKKTFIYCSMMNFCLAVETPLEVIDEIKRINNLIWHSANQCILSATANKKWMAIREENSYSNAYYESFNDEHLLKNCNKLKSK